MPKIEASTVMEHRAMREQQVLQSAADLLVQGGPKNLTPAAVAKRAKISRTAVYHYYPSSADLLIGALDHLMASAVHDLEDAIENAGPGPMDKIEAYVRTSLRSAATGYCAGIAEPTVIPASHRGRLQHWHDRLLAPLRDIAQDCKAPDATLAAQLVQGMIDAAARAVADGADLDEVTATTLVLLHAALGRPHGGVTVPTHSDSTRELGIEEPAS
ncbi:MAG: TetR/AcrR family transcriptional regulator [Bowdeniella nasicola]|nr:TetR/AcrR family transcriptional regulator [Bowdeniella nasicola]